MMRDMLDERIEVHAPTCDWVVSSGQIVCNCVPPASEAAAQALREILALRENKGQIGLPTAWAIAERGLQESERALIHERANPASVDIPPDAGSALAALEARVEVELELRKAAYERIAALE